MKKKLVAVSALVMAGMLSFPALALEESDVLGTWYLNNFTYNGVTVEAAEAGLETIMEISEAGVVSLDGQEGTWGIEGDDLSITIGEDSRTFLYENGELTVNYEEEDMVMTFGREKKEATVKGDVITNPAIEDFDGTWTIYSIEDNGDEIPASMLAQFGMEITFTLDIEGGHAKVSYSDSLSEVTTETDGSLEGDTLILKNAEADSGDMFLYGNPYDINLTLHEGNVVSYTYDDNGESECIVINFKK